MRARRPSRHDRDQVDTSTSCARLSTLASLTSAADNMDIPGSRGCENRPGASCSKRPAASLRDCGDRQNRRRLCVVGRADPFGAELRRRTGHRGEDRLVRARPHRGGACLFIRVNRLLAPAELRAQFEAYIERSLTEEIDRIEDYYRGGTGFRVATDGPISSACSASDRSLPKPWSFAHIDRISAAAVLRAPCLRSRNRSAGGAVSSASI